MGERNEALRGDDRAWRGAARGAAGPRALYRRWACDPRDDGSRAAFCRDRPGCGDGRGTGAVGDGEDRGGHRAAGDSARTGQGVGGGGWRRGPGGGGGGGRAGSGGGGRGGGGGLRRWRGGWGGGTRGGGGAPVGRGAVSHGGLGVRPRPHPLRGFRPATPSDPPNAC